MIDLMLPIQAPVTLCCPCCAPFFSLAAVIPVISLYRFPLPHFTTTCADLLLPGCWVNSRDFLPVFIELIYAFLLIRPFSIARKRSGCQHDMRMRVSVSFVMQHPIGTHSFANKILHDVFAYGIDLLLPGKFTRQRNFHFTRKLRIRTGFFTLYCIPQNVPISSKYSRGIFRQ